MNTTQIHDYVLRVTDKITPTEKSLTLRFAKYAHKQMMKGKVLPLVPAVQSIAERNILNYLTSEYGSVFHGDNVGLDERSEHNWRRLELLQNRIKLIHDFDRQNNGGPEKNLEKFSNNGWGVLHSYCLDIIGLVFHREFCKEDGDEWAQ